MVGTPIKIGRPKKYHLIAAYEPPFCQNPNLTTTQPNLNIELGLTRLLLFITPHHHPGTLLLLERMILGV